MKFLGVVLLIFVVSIVTGLYYDLKATKNNNTEFKPWENYVYSFIIFSGIAIILFLFSLALDLILGL